MSHRRVRKESDELLYTVRSLVTVRNQLPVVERKKGKLCTEFLLIQRENVCFNCST